VLLRLIGTPGDSDTVTVRIGAENDVEGLQTTSIVSTDYGFGGVGVLGPTRMDYPANIAAVRAVARYVGELLGS
jgi:heat-inducible transcriptional repressor